MKTKFFPALFLTLFFSLSFGPSLAAADEDIPYAVRIPYRIVRGITNLGLGWTEILLRPAGEWGSESPGKAVSMGAAHTLMRAAAGVQDIFTSWVPDMQMDDLYPDWETWPYLFHWS